MTRHYAISLLRNSGIDHSFIQKYYVDAYNKAMSNGYPNSRTCQPEAETIRAICGLKTIIYLRPIVKEAVANYILNKGGDNE